jgi:hypothetical protein
MTIADNVLQKQQEQREVACMIVLDPAGIIVGDRLRAFDRESVDRLKESISRIGLKTAISVRSSAHPLDARRGSSSLGGLHRARGQPGPGCCGDGFAARGSPLGNRRESASCGADRIGRAEHISQWIKLRGEREAGESCDQADDKLAQVGPVSGLISARGGRGREGGVRAAARELGISRTDAACRSLAQGNQSRVRLPPSQDRRSAAAGGAERRRHAESSRCLGRPGSSDERFVLRAGLRDRQRRMGGAAAAPTKRRLTAGSSGAPVEASEFQSLREIPLQICCRCSGH